MRQINLIWPVLAFTLWPGIATATSITIASDMVNSTSQNLNSYTNSSTNAFTASSDGFQKYQRGVSSTIPLSVLDDSVSTSDLQGIISESNTNEFFGIVDTENPDNTGPVSAEWSFNISGASNLMLSIDMGAMGDFEGTGFGADFFLWEFAIDGGGFLTLFESLIDETASLLYTMESGSSTLLNDPMTVNGLYLSNSLQTFSSAIAGTGSELALRLTAQANGGSEAIAFQNIVITDTVTSTVPGIGTIPEPTVITLFGIGLAGLFFTRRKNRNQPS